MVTAQPTRGRFGEPWRDAPLLKSQLPAEDDPSLRPARRFEALPLVDVTSSQFNVLPSSLTVS